VVDGVPVAPRAWRLKKGRELVKLLALAPRHRLHREQVMDVLWREHEPAAAANNLYQAVHAARRALGPEAIEVRDEMVSLAAGIEVDVDAFERAAADAQRSGTGAAARAALALYAGELLPENRYDDWAEEARERLESTHADLAAQAAATDDAGSGLRGLPAETSSFVGREHELTELRSLLGRTRLLTLAGTGGAGKTRLAYELVRSEQHAFADGIALVELAAVADAASVPLAAAAAMDLRALPEERLVDAICAFLAGRTVLVVLDNCEHVIAASAELVDTILRAAPHVTVLATSREPLRLTGEVVFRVPSLTIPNPDRLLSPNELLRYESVRLFVDRAVAVVPGFEIDDRTAGHVAHICFRLDGLPLALELAAGRLGALGPEAIAERLDDRFRLLQAGSRTAPTRQQTLLATLQWSHDLLDEDERVLFRRLAVFAGGFQLDAAETVCADDTLAARDVADVLARLVEKSLVSAGDRSGEWRYNLLETVREYARERLDETGETNDLARRHAHWAAELAERERDSARLDAEAANLRRALTTLLETDPDEALRFCVNIWPFWLRRIDLAEAQRRFAVVLAAAPERTSLRIEALRASAAIDYRSGTLAAGIERATEAYAIAQELGDPRAEARALQFLAEFGVAMDDGDSTWEWAERGLAFARRNGLAAAEALCVYTRGVARWMVGDLERADELLGESLDLFRAVDGDDPTPSPVNIAETRVWGDGESAPLGIVFEDTLQPFFEVSSAAAVGYVLANLATIARLRDDVDRADRLLREGTAVFAELGDDRGAASAHARRGYFELELGDVGEARASLEHSLEILRRLRERRAVGLVLSGLGLVETVAGNHEQADLRLGEARDIFRRAGDPWGLANALWRTAELARARGRLEEAWTALVEARHVLGVTQRRRWLGHTDAALAEVAALRGERALALELFASAEEQYAAAQDANGVATVEQRRAAMA
jgi:predicted ATPase